MKKELSTKLIAERLKVTENTIRRWSEHLEQAGYCYERNGLRRMYQDIDLKYFRQLQRLSKKKSLIEAIQDVTAAWTKEVHSGLQNPSHDPNHEAHTPSTSITQDSSSPSVEECSILSSISQNELHAILRIVDMQIEGLHQNLYWKPAEYVQELQHEWQIVKEAFSAYFPESESRLVMRSESEQSHV